MISKLIHSTRNCFAVHKCIDSEASGVRRDHTVCDVWNGAQTLVIICIVSPIAICVLSDRREHDQCHAIPNGSHIDRNWVRCTTCVCILHCCEIAMISSRLYVASPGRRVSYYSANTLSHILIWRCSSSTRWVTPRVQMPLPKHFLRFSYFRQKNSITWQLSFTLNFVIKLEFLLVFHYTVHIQIV